MKYKVFFELIFIHRLKAKSVFAFLFIIHAFSTLVLSYLKLIGNLFNSI